MVYRFRKLVYLDKYVWKPENRERRNAILIILLEADRSFTEIIKSLKRNGEEQSPRTLSLYLDGLIKDGCIEKTPRGKRQIYHVLKDSPEVAALLKRMIILRGAIELPALNEKEHLDVWIESVKFALLNIFQCYLEMGKGKTEKRSRGTGAIVPIENLLSEQLADLVGVCRFYGVALVKGIEGGLLDTEKVWDARNDILEEIKSKRSTYESIRFKPCFR